MLIIELKQKNIRKQVKKMKCRKKMFKEICYFLQMTKQLIWELFLCNYTNCNKTFLNKFH